MNLKDKIRSGLRIAGYSCLLGILPLITSCSDKDTTRMDIKLSQAQESLDERLLSIATKNGHLPEGSTIEDLTRSVRQKMIDSYVLKDAINLGYLPEGSPVDSLTLSVRQRMINDNKFTKYHPDGSVSQYGVDFF